LCDIREDWFGAKAADQVFILVTKLRTWQRRNCAGKLSFVVRAGLPGASAAARDPWRPTPAKRVSKTVPGSKEISWWESPVNLAPMAHAVNADDAEVVGDLVEDAVVADSNPPVMPAARLFLCPGRTGIGRAG
jgi:hypothetical protein